MGDEVCGTPCHGRDRRDGCPPNGSFHGSNYSFRRSYNQGRDRLPRPCRPHPAGMGPRTTGRGREPAGCNRTAHPVADHLTEQLRIVYRRYGLGEGEFDVLAALRRAGEPFERAPGELAVFTMVTTGAMTKRIDRLERDGLVTRRPSTSNGRGRVVALTSAGRELIDQAFTEHMRNERRLLDLLTPEDAAQLESLLATWLACFESPPHTETPAPRLPAAPRTLAGRRSRHPGIDP